MGKEKACTRQNLKSIPRCLDNVSIALDAHAQERADGVIPNSSSLGENGVKRHFGLERNK